LLTKLDRDGIPEEEVAVAVAGGAEIGEEADNEDINAFL
jgi:hypothetical protein